MADNKEVKLSNRDRYTQRLKEKYPQKEYADDEALFGQINDDYDAYDKELEDYKGREKAFSDLFTTDERSAAFITDWRKGEDPVVSLIRKFGGEFKEALDDPEKQEALAAANKEYAERIAKEKDFEDQYQKNISQTMDTLAKVQQEDGLSDDDMDKAMAFLISIMKDGILGKFAPESIRMAVKALNHDADVEDASKEAEVRGRNAKIEEKLRKGGKSDGTANLGGKNGGAKPPMPEMDLGAIERYGSGSSNIWERGSEKRTPMK